uniref:Uncharacterized protein n=1 Tax=Rhizophora mucronata TaxID=61149 RepID=A0A2P2JU65_RHIMU
MVGFHLYGLHMFPLLSSCHLPSPNHHLLHSVQSSLSVCTLLYYIQGPSQTPCHPCGYHDNHTVQCTYRVCILLGQCDPLETVHQV